jgi:hypothetical protein
MAAAVRDGLLLGREGSWLAVLRSFPGFVYLVYVGFGWAVSVLPLPRWRRIWEGTDHVLIPLAFDGLGFQRGFFHTGQFVKGGKALRHWCAPLRRTFDCGIGRSLWFSCCAQPRRIQETIAQFPLERQADLWSGVGLACVYAGEVDKSGLGELCDTSGPELASVKQGAAFAAEARWRGENPTEYTEVACRELCGMSVESAAEVCRRNKPAFRSRIGDWKAAGESYQLWRDLVREELVGRS